MEWLSTVVMIKHAFKARRVLVAVVTRVDEMCALTVVKVVWKAEDKIFTFLERAAALAEYQCGEAT